MTWMKMNEKRKKEKEKETNERRNIKKKTREWIQNWFMDEGKKVKKNEI